MSRAREASDRAAQWILLQEDGVWLEAQQAEFDAWMAASDGNKAAYWRLDSSWREADRISALGRGVAFDSEPRSRYRTARWWLPAAVAASIAVIVAIQFNPFARQQETEAAAATTYVTPVDSRRLIGLKDGSKVELNTATRVRMAMTEEGREVWLDQGEAYFEVKHIDDRPFVVHAGNRQVTALGTKFSVRRHNDKIAVSVLEGRVRLDTVDGTQRVPPMVISNGDTALAQGLSTLVTVRSEGRAERAQAWRKGMLDFDQTRLSDVAAEFNRYNSKPLVVIGSEAASIEISGVFPSSDPDAFARLLRDAYGFKIEETNEAIKISD